MEEFVTFLNNWYKDRLYIYQPLFFSKIEYIPDLYGWTHQNGSKIPRNDFKKHFEYCGMEHICKFLCLWVFWCVHCARARNTHTQIHPLGS